METWRRPRPTPEPPGTEEFRPQVLYLCQLCGNVARYPRVKSHTFHLPFGYSWTATYVTPLVCTVCRINRTDETRRIQDRRRKFWKRAIALYLGDPYPSMSPRMGRWIATRNMLGFRLRRWLGRHG